MSFIFSIKPSTAIKPFATVGIFALACFVVESTWALEVGQQVEPVTIDTQGEINYDADQDEYTYQKWSSDNLTGKVRAVQHMAGRSSAKKINQGFIDALKAAQFDHDKYQTTTIINLDDAVFGTGLLVKNKAEKSKKKFYWSSIVLDESGNAQQAWQLNPKKSAIIVLNQQGKVLFFKDGKMTSNEIKNTIALIKNTM